MKRLIVIGIGVFAIVLIVTFPASVAYRWFAPAEIKLSGVSGSVWHGAAAQGLAVDAYLTDIEWRLKPASIFSGAPTFEVGARPAGGSLAAEVAVNVGGEVVISHLHGGLPLALLHEAFQQSGIGGDVRLDFERLRIRDGMPAEAVGTILLTNVSASALSAGPLGDYRIDIQTNGSTIVGEVEDVSGVLDVSGELTLLADRSYALTGSVRTLPGAPPSLTSQLQFLGSPDTQGMRPFRFEGSL